MLKRQTLWLPTLPSLLLVLGVLVVAAVFGARQTAQFLAVTEPVAADYLVVEGWLDQPSLRQAKAWID